MHKQYSWQWIHCIYIVLKVVVFYKIMLILSKCENVYLYNYVVIYTETQYLLKYNIFIKRCIQGLMEIFLYIKQTKFKQNIW